MTASERRKIMCSVTFHVIAITCVVWSLYVLIDRTAEEIKQGQTTGMCSELKGNSAQRSWGLRLGVLFWIDFQVRPQMCGFLEGATNCEATSHPTWMFLLLGVVLKTQSEEIKSWRERENLHELLPGRAGYKGVNTLSHPSFSEIGFDELRIHGLWEVHELCFIYLRS